MREKTFSVLYAPVSDWLRFVCAEFLRRLAIIFTFVCRSLRLLFVVGDRSRKCFSQSATKSSRALIGTVRVGSNGSDELPTDSSMMRSVCPRHGTRNMFCTFV